MQKQFKVLWVSEKNGNGICIDEVGNEYYVDSSIGGFEFLSRNDSFIGLYDRISGVLCIREIGDITLNSLKAV